MQTFRQELVELGACRDSLAWLSRRGRLRAWHACPYGDWLLWYLERRDLDCRHAAYWCIERARKRVVAALPQHVASLRDCAVRSKATALKLHAIVHDLDLSQIWSQQLRSAVYALRLAAAAVGGDRPSWLSAAEATNVVWYLASLEQRQRALDAERAAIADYVRLHYEQAFLGLSRADLR